MSCIRNSKKGPYIVALDIGHSNLKTAYGNANCQFETATTPSTGIRLSKMEETNPNVFGLINQGMLTTVFGEQWVTGFSPASNIYGRVKTNDHELDSDHFWATFYSALKIQPSNEIDQLVVGLSNTHYSNSEAVEYFTKNATGTHYVSDTRTVIIHDVTVYPSGLGAFHESLNSKHESYRAKYETEYIVVSDLGSVLWDFTVIHQSKYCPRLSISTNNSLNKIFSKAENLIKKEKGEITNRWSIEAAFQDDKEVILTNDGFTQFNTYLESVYEVVGYESVCRLLQSLPENFEPYSVILTGGIRRPFQEVFFNIFEDCFVDNVRMTGNAEGLWKMAAQKLM